MSNNSKAILVVVVGLVMVASLVVCGISAIQARPTSTTAMEQSYMDTDRAIYGESGIKVDW